MAQLETTAYYAFGIPIYVSIVAVESFVLRRRGHHGITFADSLGNIGAGLGAIVVGLFLGPVLIALYDWGYAHLALVHWPPGSWVAWVLAIVMADFGHYWHHRLDHRVAACWAIHGVHHQPIEMNFTVGMRHAWFSDLYSFPFYAPLPMLGVPTSHFFAATTLLSLHALMTHSSAYSFPSLGFLVTPRTHILHHASNPRYIDKNFGAMLAIWDRLFGTHVEMDDHDQPRYGTTRGYETHDGARAQWVLVRDLLTLVRRAHGWREKLHVLTSRPGWAPASIAPLPPTSYPAVRFGIGARLYVAFQFLVTVFFSLYVFIPREQHSLAFLLVSAAALIATLVVLGGILDGRRHAWHWEAARVALCAVAGVAALRVMA
jgi:sterol desaturase/sphingolipid hydroxylase (fatty acid hydroxylase superfamily)